MGDMVWRIKARLCDGRGSQRTTRGARRKKGRYERGTRKPGSYSRVLIVLVWVVGRAGLLVLHVLAGLGPQWGHTPLLHSLQML